MSVLCSRIPQFALALAARRHPGLTRQPVALLGRDEEVCALSASAYQAGVRMGLSARQAQMRCPEIAFLAADLAECQNAQELFLAEVAQWALPVEAHGMGMAYVDLHAVTTERTSAQTLAAELGRRLRHTLGDDLQPSLGWNHSKFCARAAAIHTTAGRLKLVAKEDEPHFLAPLSVSLLPLPALALQRLQWLGITTLGQFAALPASAVWQQFGPAGQLAHRWAQGRDNRPVQNTLQATWDAREVEFETPVEQLEAAVEGLMTKLQPLLAAWAGELRGCTRLRLELCFANYERRILDLVWIEPVGQAARLRLHVTNQLAGLHWPAALDRILITHATTAELTTLQMSLFSEPTVEPATLDEVAELLRKRYGTIFLRGVVTDASHPVDERRSQMVGL